MNFLILFSFVLITFFGSLQVIAVSDTIKTSEFESNTEDDEVLNTTMCKNTKNLYANGIYLKSACLMDKGLNYYEAQKNCHRYKMELYAITNEFEMMELYKFSDSLFHNCNGCCMWVNGKKSTDGKWYAYTPDPIHLYTGIDIRDGDDFTHNYNRNATNLCNRISNQGGPVKLYISRGIDCSKKMFSYCEFYKNQS